MPANRRRPSREQQAEAARADARRERIYARDLREISRRWRAFRRRLVSSALAGSDLAPVFAAAFRPVIPLLRDSMQLAWLQGWLDTFRRAAPELRRRERAATLDMHSAALDALIARAKLTAAQRVVLRREFGALAVDALANVERSLNDRLQRALIEVTARDLTQRDAVKVLQRTVREAGVGPTKTYQLEAIYRTQTSMAYSAGHYQAAQTPLLQELIWGYIYCTSGDDRVRPSHAAMEGTRLPKEDPFWQTSTPPNGWNCHCQVIDLYEPELPQRPAEGGVPDKGFAFNPGEAFSRIGAAVSGE